jgi:hypothetical protein
MDQPNATRLKNVKQSKPPPPLLEDTFTGDWLDHQVFPELEWAVDGLIPEGLTFLVGPPKAGKSWLILNLALAIASNQPALGVIEPTIFKPRKTFYLALEDGQRRLQKRCRAVLGSEPIPPAITFKVRCKPNELESTIRTYLYHNYEPGEPAPLIVLDTLGKAITAPSNSGNNYLHEYNQITKLKDIADDHPGVAFVIIHHDRKAESEDFVHSVSGTQGISGAADTIIIMRRQRFEKEAILNVTGRDVEEKQYPIISNDNGIWELNGDSTQDAAERAHNDQFKANLGDNSRAMIDWIIYTGEVTNAEFEERFGKGTRRYLRRFLSQNRIRQVRRGVYEAIEQDQELA